MRKIILTFLMTLSLVSSAYAQDPSVEGKTYEGSLNGIATIKFEFKQNGEAIFNMTILGANETKNVTYEQIGSKIIVHAQNGDMTLTQTDNGDLSTTIKNMNVHLECQTPVNTESQITFVAGHAFSGELGSNGFLTLYFTKNGVVKVSVCDNQQEKTEEWPYMQEDNKVTMTEPMGRKITLTLNPKNQLKGLFTIINVTLSMVD